MKAISLYEVGLLINGTRILKGITWSVEPSERWVVLGPNGCGKTSLLQMLAGYRFPSEGSIEVLGRRFGEADLQGLKSVVGWVHADLLRMIPEFMTAEEVVVSGGRGRLVEYEPVGPEDDFSARGKMELLGIEALAPRRFSTLSTGERQRVLIARALMADPRILIMDEPCLGLDPLAREEYLASLERLFAEDRRITAVYVTHYVEEVAPCFQGVLILDRGQVAASGPISSTLTAANLSRVFRRECRLTSTAGRYSLSFG